MKPIQVAIYLSNLDKRKRECRGTYRPVRRLLKLNEIENKVESLARYDEVQKRVKEMIAAKEQLGKLGDALPNDDATGGDHE